MAAIAANTNRLMVRAPRVSAMDFAQNAKPKSNQLADWKPTSYTHRNLTARRGVRIKDAYGKPYTIDEKGVMRHG